ncbi:hypothetical protein AKJ09_10631 [Labilithrix luteola]|uniref:Uncharacterized protein n=1 Tax=Labilithrix luteola TaxID=1391654 RepID=A0A0K1QE19_9BACT|nr:hypothetical protein [Labilithrix luteola]AKV03968.1 hypothetical protein AKJ09_10631 [Labilithrix luteola]
MLALLRARRPFLGLIVAAACGSTFALGGAACTGDDPKLAFGQDGGSGSDAQTNEDDGSTAAPSLKLEADPLTITVGTSDTLRIRVVERTNVGKLTFQIGGKPEGMTVPSVVTLEADASALDIPIRVDESMTHGDFTLVAKADGPSFEVNAPVIVRGKPGTLDTGLGNVGEGNPGIEWSSDMKIAPLPDGRLIVGKTVGGQVNLYPLDIKGTLGKPVKMTAPGSLVGIAAASSDSAFVVAVRDGSNLSLVPYDAALTEGAPQTISSVTAAPMLLASSAGALFLQIQSGTPNAGLRIQRYTATGTKDATFTEGFQASDGSTSPQLRSAASTLTGAAWASMQVGMSQSAIVYNAATTFKGTNLVPTENCDYPAPLGEDAVFYCLNDAPTHGLRRYGTDGKAVSTFGTGGLVNFNTGTAVFDYTLSNGKDRLYFVYRLKAATGLDAITAFVGALDENGAPRTVFGTSGVTKVVGSEETPKLFVDARGRLVAWESFHDDSSTKLRLRRYWD